MPRYFFHIKDGKTSLDDVGSECADREQMLCEAVRAAGEMVRDLGQEFWAHPHWTMWVVDENGTTVLTLDFAARDINTAAELTHVSGRR